MFSLLNSNRIVSVSAILISLGTLVVFTYQTQLIREQQHLSVLPYLMLGNEGSGSANYAFTLTNNGIGPAFIESVKIFYNGEVYEMDLPNFLYDEIPAMDSIRNIYHSNIYPGMLLPAGEKVPILQVDNSFESAVQLGKLLERLNEKDLDIEIIYRSVYEERWKITGESLIPIELD